MSQLKNVLRFNRSRRTVTLRRYDEKGKFVCKYRSYPMFHYTEELTDDDIAAMLRRGDFYWVK